MTKSSYSINGKADQDVINSYSKSDQTARKNNNTSTDVTKGLFGSPLGKRNYEKTDAAKAWGQLIKQWQQYEEHPTEENRNNLVSPIRLSKL